MTVWMLALAAFSVCNFATATDQFTYENQNGSTVRLSFKTVFRYGPSEWNVDQYCSIPNILQSPNFKFLETVNLERHIHGQVLLKTNANFKYPYAFWTFYKDDKDLTVTLCTSLGDKLPWKAHKLSGTRKFHLVDLFTSSKDRLGAIFAVDDNMKICVELDNSGNPVTLLWSSGQHGEHLTEETIQDYKFSRSHKEQSSIEFVGLVKLMIKKHLKYSELKAL